LSTPLIAVNFKVYREAEGPKALEISGICASVSEETGVTIAVCPPATELGHIARTVNIPIFSQNADPYPPGASTGWVTPSMIKASGAAGTLINHAEHRRTAKEITEIIRLSKECGLATVVCADTVRTAMRISRYGPDMIAVEPPELIGGSVSVTDADPKIVENTVSSVKNINKNIAVLCGAGVKTGKDVKKALELGADGVLLASGIIRSKDPRASLLDLVRYL
jgi:triosephosphate isomerase